MNRPTQESKIKKDELPHDENSELTDEALEQVSGGAFGLKKETQPHSGSGSGKVNVQDLSLTKWVDRSPG